MIARESKVELLFGRLCLWTLPRSARGYKKPMLYSVVRTHTPLYGVSCCTPLHYVRLGNLLLPTHWETQP